MCARPLKRAYTPPPTRSHEELRGCPLIYVSLDEFSVLLGMTPAMVDCLVELGLPSESDVICLLDVLVWAQDQPGLLNLLGKEGMSGLALVVSQRVIEAEDAIDEAERNARA